jgi:hypothetical protein
MKQKQLLRRLQDAAVCCNECGLTYGVCSVGYSSTWMGVCHVCGQETRVTETRDYGYFRKGIRELKIQLEEEKIRKLLK